MEESECPVGLVVQNALTSSEITPRALGISRVTGMHGSIQFENVADKHMPPMITLMMPSKTRKYRSCEGLVRASMLLSTWKRLFYTHTARPDLLPGCRTANTNVVQEYTAARCVAI